MKKTTIKTNITYCLTQASFWCANCVVSTFAALFLQSLGYTNTELGIIVALGCILGFILPMIVSPVVDRSGRLNASVTVIFFQTVGFFLGLCVFLIEKKSTALSLFYVLWEASMLTTSSMVPQISQDYCHEGHKINFGIARACGSLGFVVIVSVLGRLMENVSASYLPLFGMTMGLCVICTVFILAKVSGRKELFKNAPSDTEQAKSSGLGKFLKGNPDYVLLLAGIGLIFSASEFFGIYMINVVESLGGSSSDMGNIHALSALAEIPSMVLWAKISKGSRAKKLLVISLFFFTVKNLYFALAPSVTALYFGSVFQMIGYGMYTPAIVDHIGRTIPFKDSAKAQSLVVAVGTFGSVVASLAGGILNDRIDIHTTLLIDAALSLAGSLTAAFAVSRSKSK